MQKQTKYRSANRQCQGSALATASMRPLANAAMTTFGGKVPLAVSGPVATYSADPPMNANLIEPCAYASTDLRAVHDSPQLPLKAKALVGKVWQLEVLPMMCTADATALSTAFCGMAINIFF